jgi:hypothetical protein
MKRSTLAVRVVLLAISIIAVTGIAQAQYRASIQGVVTDPTGAVVPGATLTLTNVATGEAQVRTSNGDGVYNFNALAVTTTSTYRLDVEKQGFQKKTLDHLELIPEQANALNVELDVGNTSQTVTVNGDAIPAIDTESASLNGVVTDNQIEHMPSFGRDVTKLTQLAPGMFADGSQVPGGQYQLPGTQSGPAPSGGEVGIFATENLVQGYANGNQAQNSGISIDGISTTSAVWGGSTVITPSEDSVDNVKVITNSYDAENGRFTGAQVQITSKAGSNNFHGSLFFTTHQPGLNAYQPYFGQAPGTEIRDNSKFNQFGGSVGGPIWKNKIFAFFNYETVREPHAGFTATGWYDTSAFDALATSGGPIAAQYLAFPGNSPIGTILSPTCGDAGLNSSNCLQVSGGLNLGTPLTNGVGKQDLGWTSVANPGCGGAGTGCAPNGSSLGSTPDIAEYSTVNSTIFNAAQYNGRLDADVTSKDRLTFSIYWVPQSTTFYNGGDRGYDIFHASQINDAFAGIWNHTFSPTMLNEARVNAAGWRWNQINSNPQSPVGFPSDYIGQIGSITPNQFGPAVGSIFNQWTYSYKDVATKIIGRNTIKFGGEVTRLFYLQNNVGGGVPSYNFYNMWDFLNDAPYNESANFNPTTGLPTTVRQDDRTDVWGFFVQDDLKLRPNLTLNIGLRWSYFGPLSSKEGNMFVATPGSGVNYMTDLDVHLGHSWNAQKDNLSPEIGFAWSPTQFHDRFVIRGGFGLNFNQEEIAISSSIVTNPGISVSPYLGSSSPSFINPDIVYALSSGPRNLYGYPDNPNTVSTFGANGLPSSGASVAVEIFPNTLPTARTYHYSLDTQYDLGHQFVMSLGYQGSISRDLFFHQNPNVLPATMGWALNPAINGTSGTGDYWNNDGRGNYNAMLAELKHQFSHQFMADAQYTFARSMDTSSAPYSEQPYPFNLNYDYGRSDYNITSAFKLFGMWQPLFFRGSNGWLEKIAGGWSLSGIWNWHSGFPWTPEISIPGSSTIVGQAGSLYCGTCGYTTILPAAYLGGAGHSTSNKAFEGSSSSNFPLASVQGNADAYFSTPAYFAYQSTNYGNALPQAPGVARGFLTLPGYKDVDLTIAKSFGLPKEPVLGENARFELRMDVYNVFNNLNLNPNDISNNIANSNFGTISGALQGRDVVLGARFNF